jgi:quinol monooxygenase YgiN
MIHVIATVTVQPGRRDDFLEIFKALIPAVKAEAGCRAYEPTVDVDAGLRSQGDLRGDVVVIVETWESLAALQAHLQAPHMLTYKEQVKDLVAGVDLQVLQPA